MHFKLLFTTNVITISFIITLSYWACNFLYRSYMEYFYVSSITNQQPIKKINVFLHLIPAIFTVLYLIPFLLLPSSEKIEIFENQGKDYELFQSILLIAINISGVLYISWAIKVLKEHKKYIRNRFSTIEKIDLQWLQFLTYGLGVIWILIIITKKNDIIFLWFSVFVILIGFFGVKQKNIIDSDKKQLENPEPTNNFSLEIPKEKYAKSGLSEEQAEKQYQKLMALMTKESYYKNSDLSLSQLAEKLNIHSNYLSQIINENGGISFYDFVNQFRVAEFKRLVALPENRQFTLITLAYECGFNSKSSFNRYFKKITGQTPSQYAKFISQ